MNKLNEEIRKMKNIMNVLGEKTNSDKITCKNCKHNWDLEYGDQDQYLCHQCGFDNKTDKFEKDKTLKWWSNKLNETLDEFEKTEMPTSFNVNFFKTLKSFNKKVQYCNQTLKRISSGSSRIAYMIGNNKVLKLAKNKKGLEQNNTESDGGFQSWHSDIVTLVYEHDENNEWIISEFAKNISEKRFEQITGINFQKLCAFLRLEDDNNRYKDKTVFTQEEIDAFYENPYSDQLVQLMANYDMPSGDLCRINSYGEVNRDGESMAVLRDYGLTDNTINTLYRK